jgi:hypothetical protein
MSENNDAKILDAAAAALGEHFDHVVILCSKDSHDYAFSAAIYGNKHVAYAMLNQALWLEEEALGLATQKEIDEIDEEED